MVLGYTKLPKEYLEQLGKVANRKFISGYEFTSFTWEASIFLPFLEQKFITNGGRIVRKEIVDFEELESYDVIVNSAGLNARNLTGIKGRFVSFFYVPKSK